MAHTDRLQELIAEKLKPYVKRIDTEAYYASDFLKSLGQNGFLDSSEGIPYSREVMMVEEIAKVCMTTAFNFWCHLAAMTYIRQSTNLHLKEHLLPQFENGSILGATGLSNPMKYYAGLEKLHLRAKKVDGGYIISGKLPSVSNLGDDHWFGIVAEVDDTRRIMAIVPCQTEGLSLKAKAEYLGVNGSATFACSFEEVWIPDNWIVAADADVFIPIIRPAFVLYQTPLGFGVTRGSIDSILQVCNKQMGCNSYLPIQSEELEEQLVTLKNSVYAIAKAGPSVEDWKELLKLRLDVAYLAAKATHGTMLHQGGAGYLMSSGPSRRLRESYFLLNLTPTVKHLEKLLHSN